MFGKTGKANSVSGRASRRRLGPPLRVRRRPSGFTLIELLVAVGLSSLLLSMLVFIFNQASTVTITTGARVEMYQNARCILARMESELSAISLAGNGYLWMLNRTYGTTPPTPPLTLVSATSNELSDFGQGWDPDQWKGYTVNVTTGGRTYSTFIVGNSSDALLLSPGLPAKPQPSDEYEILALEADEIYFTTNADNQGASGASAAAVDISEVAYYLNAGGSAWQSVLQRSVQFDRDFATAIWATPIDEEDELGANVIEIGVEYFDRTSGTFTALTGITGLNFSAELPPALRVRLKLADDEGRQFRNFWHVILLRNAER